MKISVSEAKKVIFTALSLTPFIVCAEPLNFNAMVKKCAKDIDPMTFQAIARTESSFNPFAIGVVSGSLNVNLAMIEQGYAWHYEHYSNNRQYAQAQKNAQSQKRGLWADKGKIVKPEEFRHQ